MGEEQSRLVVIRLREMRCVATLASRLRAVLGPVAGAMAVEAGVVAVRLAFATGATSLSSLPAAATVAPLATVALGLLLLAAAGTPAMLLGRTG